MELVIVIAVIAVLAAVLIPTFANIIQRANESNDISVARNMNTILATEQIGGEAPSNMEEVTYILTQNGYKLENLTPTADGNIFVWDSATNRLIYVSGETGEVLYSENNAYATISDIPNTAYVTVHNVDEIKDWAERSGKDGISFYFAANIDVGTLEFTKPCSIDTGTYTLTGTVNYTNVTTSTDSAVNIEGNIDKVVINSPNGTFENYANIDTVEIEAVDSNSYHEYGYVKTLTVNATSGKVVIEDTGMVDMLNVQSGVTTSITNNGYIVAADSEHQEYVTDVEKYIYNIDDYADLANFRDKVNAGNHFTGINVSLNTDINLTGRAWVPIGYDSRDNHAGDNYIYFAGTFNGNNHTVRGLSNVGYIPTTTRTDTYGTGSNIETKNNYVYGFFGIIGKGVVVENLNFTSVNITQEEGADAYLDSVGAVAGFIEGEATISNCNVSGNIYGYDAVAGIVGRIYDRLDYDTSAPGAVTITSCVNNANITGTAKVAGIVGYLGTVSFVTESGQAKVVTITKCVNNGVITSNELNATSYTYGIVGFGYTSEDVVCNYVITDNTNNGDIINNSTNKMIAYIAGNCSNSPKTGTDTYSFTGNINSVTLSTTYEKQVVYVVLTQSAISSSGYVEAETDVN